MPSAVATDITQVSEDELTAQLTQAGAEGDEAAIDRILAELNRRDEIEEVIRALVEQGLEYREAYAIAHDLDPAELDRQERAAIVASSRRKGESLEQAVDRLYGEMTRQRYRQAEDECRGHLLNPAGKAAGVDPYSLFHGPASRVRRYASPELRTWFYRHGRTTWIEYKAQMLGRASDVAKAARVDRDFGEAVA
ncbi:hypothetical protein [Saccharothrix hoggarensis]|uniref:Chorismate mutase n=1 Tax=Saccharothrix hoggarensis TaxID=913853 RepID=A0ABW3QDM9_9PSEU